MFPLNIFFLARGCPLPHLQSICADVSGCLLIRSVLSDALPWRLSIGMCGSTSGCFISLHSTMNLLLTWLTPYQVESFRVAPESDQTALALLSLSIDLEHRILFSSRESACLALQDESAELWVVVAMVLQRFIAFNPLIPCVSLFRSPLVSNIFSIDIFLKFW